MPSTDRRHDDLSALYINSTLKLQAGRSAPRPPHRVLAAAVTMLAVAGIVACSTSHSAQAARVTVCVTPVVTCTDEMQTEPATITTSADGAVYIKALTWSNWGSATAVGSGTLERDNCQPSCAQGTYSPYPATVTLSGLTPYGNGEMAYAVMTISAPANGYHETFSQDLVP